MPALNQNTALRKSVRTLFKLEDKVHLNDGRTEDYLVALSYREKLYEEYGKHEVRAEINRQKAARMAV